MISLTHQQPIASGCERLIYQHPQSFDLLIKIIQPHYITSMQRRWWFALPFVRMAQYWVFLNELKEQLTQFAVQPQAHRYLQNIVGIIYTDLGLGLVVKAIRAPHSQQLAPTLETMMRDNLFELAHQTALDEFCDWLAACPVIVRDLNHRNIVWDASQSAFVLIDGFGEQLIPSLRTFWPSYNLRHNRRKALKLKARIEQHLNRRKLNTSAAY